MAVAERQHAHFQVHQEAYAPCCAPTWRQVSRGFITVIICKRPNFCPLSGTIERQDAKRPETRHILRPLRGSVDPCAATVLCNLYHSLLGQCDHADREQLLLYFRELTAMHRAGVRRKTEALPTFARCRQGQGVLL